MRVKEEKIGERYVVVGTGNGNQDRTCQQRDRVQGTDAVRAVDTAFGLHDFDALAEQRVHDGLNHTCIAHKMGFLAALRSGGAGR